MSDKFPACAAATTFALLLSATIISAKKHPQIQQDNSSAPEAATSRWAQHGRPAETYAVAPGTKFLVVLEQDLTTKDTQENTKFIVRTVEPLEAGSGIYLPPGAEVHGARKPSRIRRAVAGRAKIWLDL